LFKLFGVTEKATFLERPNRFTLQCRLKGKVVRAYLPNPGRLWELLLPESTIYLEKNNASHDRMPYTAVAIEREGRPVMVHTHKTNDLAQYLIKRDLIPGLEGSEIIKREISINKSRFDFLLKRRGKEVILEVKSCTLFGNKVSMFPDAITERGRRHVEELAALSQGGTAGAVLFLICWPWAEYFLPEYHTDLEFARALYSVREKISIFPVALELQKDLSVTEKVRVLEIPWHIVEKEAEDRGCYVLIIKIPADSRIEIGSLGEIPFRKGYYVYIGSARKNLSQRIKRHVRIRKRNFWHIDYLRGNGEFHAVLPVRTGDLIECEMAQAVRGLGGWEITGFGSSSCSCASHLFGMVDNPFHAPRFISLLQHFRMDRVVAKRKERMS
jgi:sugar fermentation stimulation protein A